MGRLSPAAQDHDALAVCRILPPAAGGRGVGRRRVEQPPPSCSGRNRRWLHRAMWADQFEPACGGENLGGPLILGAGDWKLISGYAGICRLADRPTGYPPANSTPRKIVLGGTQCSK